MMKYILICSVFFIAFAGCKKDLYSGMDFVPPVFADSVYVKSEVLNDTIFTKSAWGMASYKDYIILLANIDDFLFQIYDKKTGLRVKSFGKLGRAPQEILPTNNFYVSETKCILTSYSQSTREILVFHLDSIIPNREHFLDKISLNGCSDMTFFEVLPVHENFLLYGGKCAVYPGGARYTLFSRQGQYLGAYDKYPISSTSDSIQKGSEWMDLGLTRTISPDGTKLAEATRVGGILEILEVTSQMKQTALKTFYQPHFYQDKGDQNYTPNTLFGFYYLNSSSQAIYALSFNGSNNEMLPSCDLQTFDWSGNPVKKYKTDKPLLNICVDEKAKKAYALSQTPMHELTLISFDL